MPRKKYGNNSFSDPRLAIADVKQRAIVLLESQGIEIDQSLVRLIFDISGYAVDYWILKKKVVSVHLFDSTLAAIAASVELLESVVTTGKMPKNISINTTAQ